MAMERNALAAPTRSDSVLEYCPNGTCAHHAYDVYDVYDAYDVYDVWTHVSILMMWLERSMDT
jgi:hypothetical protein